MAWILVVAFAALAVAVLIGIRHGLMRLQGTVREAWAALFEQLRKRQELLKRILELCGRLMHYERETIERAAHAGTAVLNAAAQGDIRALAAAEQAHRAAVGDLLTLAGNYPQLATSTAFAALCSRVDELDQRVDARAEQYNEAANLLNVRRGAFPHRLVARALGVAPAGMLA